LKRGKPNDKYEDGSNGDGTFNRGKASSGDEQSLKEGIPTKKGLT